MKKSIFVVHEHHARNLNQDFSRELHRVLKFEKAKNGWLLFKK